jgi:hypothetical protein
MGLNNVDASNFVNGKPAAYWVNQQNRVVPSDAGWVVLSNCTSITVKALTSPVEAAKYNTITIDSTVKNVLSKNGISLYHSHDNTIEDNKIVDADYAGLGCNPQMKITQ